MSLFTPDLTPDLTPDRAAGRLLDHLGGKDQPPDVLEALRIVMEDRERLRAACRYALQFLDEWDVDGAIHPSLRRKLEAAIAAVRKEPT